MSKIYGHSTSRTHEVCIRLLGTEVMLQIAEYATSRDLAALAVKKYKTLPIARTRKAVHAEDICAIINGSTERILRMNGKVREQSSFGEILWCVTRKEFSVFCHWMSTQGQIPMRHGRIVLPRGPSGLGHELLAVFIQYHDPSLPPPPPPLPVSPTAASADAPTEVPANVMKTNLPPKPLIDLQDQAVYKTVLDSTLARTPQTKQVHSPFISPPRLRADSADGADNNAQESGEREEQEMSPVQEVFSSENKMCEHQKPTASLNDTMSVFGSASSPNRKSVKPFSGQIHDPRGGTALNPSPFLYTAPKRGSALDAYMTKVEVRESTLHSRSHAAHQTQSPTEAAGDTGGVDYSIISSEEKTVRYESVTSPSSGSRLSAYSITLKSPSPTKTSDTPLPNVSADSVDLAIAHNAARAHLKIQRLMDTRKQQAQMDREKAHRRAMVEELEKTRLKKAARAEQERQGKEAIEAAEQAEKRLAEALEFARNEACLGVTAQESFIQKCIAYEKDLEYAHSCAKTVEEEAANIRERLARDEMEAAALEKNLLEAAERAAKRAAIERDLAQKAAVQLSIEKAATAAAASEAERAIEAEKNALKEAAKERERCLQAEADKVTAEIAEKLASEALERATADAAAAHSIAEQEEELARMENERAVLAEEEKNKAIEAQRLLESAVLSAMNASAEAKRAEAEAAQQLSISRAVASAIEMERAAAIHQERVDSDRALSAANAASEAEVQARAAMEAEEAANKAAKLALDQVTLVLERRDQEDRDQEVIAREAAEEANLLAIAANAQRAASNVRREQTLKELEERQDALTQAASLAVRIEMELHVQAERDHALQAELAAKAARERQRVIESDAAALTSEVARKIAAEQSSLKIAEAEKLALAAELSKSKAALERDIAEKAMLERKAAEAAEKALALQKEKAIYDVHRAADAERESLLQAELENAAARAAVTEKELALEKERLAAEVAARVALEAAKAEADALVARKAAKKASQNVAEIAAAAKAHEKATTAATDSVKKKRVQKLGRMTLIESTVKDMWRPDGHDQQHHAPKGPHRAVGNPQLLEDSDFSQERQSSTPKSVHMHAMYTDEDSMTDTPQLALPGAPLVPVIESPPLMEVPAVHLSPEEQGNMKTPIYDNVFDARQVATVQGGRSTPERAKVLFQSPSESTQGENMSGNHHLPSLKSNDQIVLSPTPEQVLENKSAYDRSKSEDSEENPPPPPAALPVDMRNEIKESRLQPHFFGHPQDLTTPLHVRPLSSRDAMIIPLSRLYVDTNPNSTPVQAQIIDRDLYYSNSFDSINNENGTVYPRSVLSSEAATSGFTGISPEIIDRAVTPGGFRYSDSPRSIRVPNRHSSPQDMSARERQAHALQHVHHAALDTTISHVINSSDFGSPVVSEAESNTEENMSQPVSPSAETAEDIPVDAVDDDLSNGPQVVAAASHNEVDGSTQHLPPNVDTSDGKLHKDKDESQISTQWDDIPESPQQRMNIVEKESHEVFYKSDSSTPASPVANTTIGVTGDEKATTMMLDEISDNIIETGSPDFSPIKESVSLSPIPGNIGSIGTHDFEQREEHKTEMASYNEVEMVVSEANESNDGSMEAKVGDEVRPGMADESFLNFNEPRQRDYNRLTGRIQSPKRESGKIQLPLISRKPILTRLAGFTETITLDANSKNSLTNLSSLELLNLPFLRTVRNRGRRLLVDLQSTHPSGNHYTSWDICLWTVFQLYGKRNGHKAGSNGAIAQCLPGSQLRRMLKDANVDKDIRMRLEISMANTTAMRERFASKVLLKTGSSTITTNRSRHGQKGWGSFISFSEFSSSMDTLVELLRDRKYGPAVVDTESQSRDHHWVATRAELEKELRCYCLQSEEDRNISSGINVSNTSTNFSLGNASLAAYDERVAGQHIQDFYSECLSSVVPRNAYASNPFVKHVEDHMISPEKLDSTRLLWMQNMESMKAIYTFYATSQELRAHLPKDLSIAVTAELPLVTAGSGWNEFSSLINISHQPSSAGNSATHIRLLSFDDCKNFLADFAVFPNVIEYTQLSRLFKSVKLWEWELSESVSEKYISLKDQISAMELPTVTSLRSLDPLGVSNTSGNMCLSPVGLIEFVTRIAVLAYKQYTAESDVCTRDAVVYLLRVMNDSSGRAKVMRSHRTGFNLRPFNTSYHHRSSTIDSDDK